MTGEEFLNLDLIVSGVVSKTEIEVKNPETGKVAVIDIGDIRSLIAKLYYQYNDECCKEFLTEINNEN